MKKKRQRQILGIRRPTSGVCQFCLKMISAPNWSRHIKAMHREELNEMVLGEHLPVEEEELLSSPEKEEVKLNQEEPPPTIGKIEPKIEDKEEVKIRRDEQNQHGTSAEVNNEEEDDEEDEQDGVPEDQQPLRKSKRNAGRKLVVCALRLPKSNICPICQTKTSASNWSRHLKRYHPSYTIVQHDLSPPTQVPRQQVQAVQQQADLPLLHLEQFLAQQMHQHSNNNNDFDLFTNNQMRDEMSKNVIDNRLKNMIKEEIKIGQQYFTGFDDGVGGSSMQQQEEGDQPPEVGTSSSSGNAMMSQNMNIKEIFPQRKTIIRRPGDGICRFCVKQISASNWSRHIRTKHIEDILKIRQISGEEPISFDSIFQPSEKFATTSAIEAESNVENDDGFDDADDKPMATVIAEPIIQVEVKSEITEGSSNVNDGAIDFEETMAEVIDGQLQQQNQGGLRRSQRMKTSIKKSKSAIKLPKSGICPICERKVSSGNWSRHLKRYHPEYASIEDVAVEQHQQIDGMEGVIEGLMQFGMEFIVPIEELRSFIIRCMQSAGTSFAHAVQLAELLIDADISGHSSFGLSQLPICIGNVLSGKWKGTGEPTILKQKGSTALVDGANLVGPVIGNFCTDLAIKLAKEHGLGWVLARNANHYGLGQYYAKRIDQVGMVGMSFANSPLQKTQQSVDCPSLMTISCSANSQNSGDCLLVNLSNSNGAEEREEEGVEMATRGNKEIGFGLGMMLEMLCGVMANGDGEQGKFAANSGECFIAIDPECFASGFPVGLQNLLNQTREIQSAIPGDQERQNAQRNQDAGGVIYKWAQMREIEQLAAKCRVQLFPYKQKQQK